MKTKEQFVNSFLAAASPATKSTMKSLWKNHLERQLEKEQNLKILVDNWIEKELSIATIRKLITLYKAWYFETFNKEIDLKIISKRLRKISYRKPRPSWTKEEATKALNVAKLDQDLYNMMLFTLHTGVRKGEMFGLKWEDVKNDYSTITVHNLKIDGRPRIIKCSAEVQTILKSITRENFCFIFQFRELNKPLARICEMAKIPKISWHCLRASFATIALEAGVSLKRVSNILGHAKVSTTLDLYWRMPIDEIDFTVLPR